MNQELQLVSANVVITHVRMLRKALADAQRNHHKQMMAYGIYSHQGTHWQHCRAVSCKAASATWKATDREYYKEQRAWNRSKKSTGS